MNEHFEENDGSQPEELLSDLLEAHYASSLPDHLRERIDQELAQALQNKTQANSSSTLVSTNGKAAVAEPSNSRNRSIWRRPLVRFVGIAAATVACWFILFSGVGGSNSSWASVVKALQQQPWLQVVSGDEEHGWLSVPSRIIGHVRTKSGTAGRTFWRNGERSVYLAANQAIYQDPVESDLRMSNEDFVKAFFLRLVFGHLADEELSQWRLIEESRTAGEDVSQLSVRFEHANSSRSVTLILGIDEESQHPIWMRVLDPDGSTKQLVSFNYVAEGPESIYELGAPRDSAVIKGLATAKFTGEVDQATVNTQTLSSDAPVDQSLSNREKNGLSRSASSVATRSSLEISRRVDELLSQHWQSVGVKPTEPATDFEFLRRIYLDLMGRIPTIAEIRRFETEPKDSRRTALLNTLLESRDSANHFGAVWRAILLPREADLSNLGGSEKLDQWLAEKFRDNVPYNVVVEEVLLAEGRVTETGPLLFYAAAKMNPEEIATQASRAFLGTRMECAQCHDHPFDHWTQEEFWGLAAYFARISRPQGELEMVSPVLRVADNDWGDVTLPESETIVAPQFPFPLVDAIQEEEQVSRRRQLADWLTAPSNAQFSRATVNRVWAHLFGRGLVDPVDDMGSHNPPVCPEVLDELTTYFVQIGFDLRRLIATLVETKAYQLSSRSLDDSPERNSAFAQMNIKSFTAEQLYDSIATATLRQGRLGSKSDDAVDLMGNIENRSRERFLELFRVPPGSLTDYQAGIPQALMLINGGVVSEATVETGELLQSLQAPFFSDEQRIEMLFLATLSRKPTAQESEQMQSYLSSTDDDSTTKQRLSDVLWTLLNSAEFTLNH